MSARCRLVYLLSAALLSTGVGRAENAKLQQRVYQVADLVVPSSSAVTGGDRLIKRITHTIAPRSWSERGGRGTIDFFPCAMTLVVNQTAAIQEQVADLLAAQRRIQDMQVAVEIKFVTLSAEMFEDMQRYNLVGKGDKNVTFLNDAQMRHFIEAIQGDGRSNVMQAPKLTMFNGQNAALDITDEHHFVTGLEIVHCGDRIDYRPKSETIPLGLQADLHSVVSADRRSVRVHLDATLSNLDSSETPPFPITTPAPGKEKGPDGKPRTVTHYIDQPQVSKACVNRTLVIPDGKTAVLTGWKKPCEVTTNIGPEFLGEIPYLGQLFRKVECETHHLVVMVTPRIIVDKEEEQKKPRTLPGFKAKDCPKVGCACVTPVSVSPAVEEKQRVQYSFEKEYRTPILEPIHEGKEPLCEEPPDEATILRAMLPIENHFPGLLNVSRDNVQVVVERIVDKIDPPRFFPLIGPAQLHHCHWKCSVYYLETVEGSGPFSFRVTKPKMDIVYIDKDHLHLYEGDSKTGR